MAEGCWDKVQIGIEDENSYSENFRELSLICVPHASKFVPFRFVCFFLNFYNIKNMKSEKKQRNYKALMLQLVKKTYSHSLFRNFWCV